MTFINIKHKYAGYYQLLVHDKDGNLKQDTGWFHNLITDQGLNMIGDVVGTIGGSYDADFPICRCGVGTGNTAPANTDTTLTAPLAMYPANSNAGIETFSNTSYTAGPPAYWSGILVFNFPAGSATGTLAEVGVGAIATNTDTTPYLFSHALITDSGGTPTTITVTSTDALTVNFELRMYVDLTDNTYSVTISGTTYTGTYRRADVGTVPNYNQLLSYNFSGVSFATGLLFYDGTIDVVTSHPSGSNAGGGNDGSTTVTAYTLGTYYQNFSYTLALTYGNFTGGITAMMIYSNHGRYQYSISPAIPKTSSYTLTINYSISWTRY